jgi:hypothetical protein
MEMSWPSINESEERAVQTSNWNRQAAKEADEPRHHTGVRRLARCFEKAFRQFLVIW